MNLGTNGGILVHERVIFPLQISAPKFFEPLGPNFKWLPNPQWLKLTQRRALQQLHVSIMRVQHRHFFVVQVAQWSRTGWQSSPIMTG